MLALIRRNEKEVLELIKNKAPDFFDRLLQPDPARKKRTTKKGTGRRSRLQAAA